MTIIFSQFPTTRYQGSKRKLLPWLYKNIAPLQFHTAVDVFGGTGMVSYLFKKMGKQVHFNDCLRMNYLIGKALIENQKIKLDESDVKFLTTRHKTISYSTFVQDTFHGIYYNDAENEWIDVFLTNWMNFSNNYSERVAKFKKAVAFNAFVQSALKKRPFNLFHRANLYIRTNDVERSFGNKTSWEGSFVEYFTYFVNEVNESIFDNFKRNTVSFKMASELKITKPDLVYIDPPYIREGVSGTEVDYLRFYHFLEGASDPLTWGNRIDYSTKTLRLKHKKINSWISPSDNRSAFERLFEAYQDSMIVVSYKEPGIPTKQQLIYSLKKFKKNVTAVRGKKYDYALNKNNGFHKEYILIGKD